MLFSSYFRLTLALLPAITAYTLDPNLPDGVYAVQPAHSAKFTRHDGEIHGGPVRIGNVGPQSVPRLYATGLNGTSNATLDHGTEKRGVPLPISDSHCSTWNRLNEEDYSYALAGLKARCDTEEIPAYKYIIAKAGSVFVYACSWGGQQTCNNEEIDYFDKYSNEKCGPLGSYIFMEESQKSYGRDVPDSDIC